MGRSSSADDLLRTRVYRAVSSIHGQGCFAKIAFRGGDFIGTYEGREVDRDGTYVLWAYDAEGNVLTAREGRNLLRWLNHSDDPNTEFDGFDLYARRAIAVDEEITFNYGGA
jgi:SET domain-containing protein